MTSIRIGLKKRILLLICVPLFLVVVAGVFISHQVLDEIAEGKQLVANSNTFIALSNFIHNLQRERVNSSYFYNDKISLAELTQFRKGTDSQIEVVESALGLARLGLEERESWNQQKEKLAEVRRIINAKEISTLDEAVKTITGIVSTALKIQFELSRTVSFKGEQERILSMALINAAKESAGLLRFTGVNILVNDKPLTPQQLNRLNTLELGVTVTLDSPAMHLSPDGFQQIKAFKVSEDWKRVLNITKGIVEKAETGNYGYDSKEFYNLMTASIDFMMGLVNKENSTFVEALQIELKETSVRIYTLIAVVAITLIGCFALMIKMTQSVVVGVTGATKSLHELATEMQDASRLLSASSHQLSAGATQTAASLEETVASTEELSSIVKISTQSAETAAQLSREGASKAEEGEKSTKELVSSMKEISQSAMKIQEITHVIDDLAFQTNILALNAAVEAARAGEQGKGFAVVAEAVRNLAAKSASAAQDIHVLISESVDKIGKGAQIVSANGDSLNLLVQNVLRVNQLNTEINRASHEQEQGFTQIAQAMNQVDTATQSNASAAEEVSALSEKLSDQARNLSEVVSRLNVIVQG